MSRTATGLRVRAVGLSPDAAAFSGIRVGTVHFGAALVSAGIGVTPMLGFLRHLDAIGSEREVVVLHADRAEERHAHRAEVAELVAALPGARQVRWYEELAGEPVPDAVRLGRIDLGEVPLPEGATAYLCGPVPFMAVVKASLIERGVPAERIRYEVFGPAQELVA